MEKIIEFLKGLGSFALLILLGLILVFSVVGELFPTFVPQWYYDYIVLPIFLLSVAALIIYLIKHRKKK